VLHLQRTAGNQAVQRLLSAAQKAENLRSTRYSGNPRLEAAFDNSPVLGAGERGHAVALIQRGLVDDRIPLPRSTLPTGALDGIFGAETLDAVRTFQTRHDIAGPDGRVGRLTLGVLDQLAGGGTRPPPPPCTDVAVNLEPDPIPLAPPPTVSFVPAPQILEQAKRRQAPGQFIPRDPPLGATFIDLTALSAVTASGLSKAGQPCLTCTATWSLPVPVAEILVAQPGTFLDTERRFFASQPGNVNGCPPHDARLLPVGKQVLAEAIPKLIQAELEHWVDFRDAFQLLGHRFLANIGRLTPDRSHLRGADQAACQEKVDLFLRQAALQFDQQMVGTGYSDTFRRDFTAMYVRASTVRDAGPHDARATPPRPGPPIQPNLDTARNPFGCTAFLRVFRADCAPGVPGAPKLVAPDPVLDAPKRPWHSL
jgi:peptidoglycan hydrolase-like protein with peptidoglycan-binding domain